MKLLIFLFLLLLFLFYAPDPTPRPIRVRPVRIGGTPRRWEKAFILPRVAIRVQVVRL